MEEQQNGPTREPQPEGHAGSGPDTPESDQSRTDPAAALARQAEDELKKAREVYERMRRQATEQLRKVRGKSVEELFEGGRSLVQKYPATGVAAALAVGFCLGRLLKR